MAIREYNAPEDLTIRPSDRATSAAEHAGRRIQGAYNEAAAAQRQTGHILGSAIEVAGSQAVKQIEHAEVSNGAKNLAKLHADATNMWNETIKNADPNDPTVAPKFMAGLEENLEKMRSGFATEGGQKWADQRVAAMREHMTTKTQSDMSRAAGQAITANHMETLNSLTNTVRGDPSSLKETLALWQAAHEKVVQTSPNLRAEDIPHMIKLGEHGREQIVKAAFMGLAEANPDEAEKRIQDPNNPYAKYLSGADAKAILANVKQQRRAERVDETYNQHLRDIQKKEVSEYAENEILKKLYSEKPEDRVSVNAKSIANDDRLTPATKEKMINRIEHEAAKKESPAQSDPATRQGLATRLFDPTNPTTLEDVIKAHAERKLSDNDYVKLRQNVMDLKKDPLAGPATQAAIHAAKDQLTYQMPGLPGKDPKGSQQYADFMSEFTERYLRLPPEERAKATNFQDKTSLINELITKYDRTPTQKLQDRIAEMSTLGQTSSSAPAPKTFVAPPTWEWSASRRQYRDPTTGKQYDASGNEVKK